MSSPFTRKISFGYRFATIERLQAAISRREILALGITPAQIPFLAELFHEKAPITQEALSRALSIDPAATARALTELEKKGLVCRKINPTNRRQKLVIPSPKAMELEPAFYAILQKSSERLVEGFTQEEREAALDLLDRIMANGVEAKRKIKG